MASVYSELIYEGHDLGSVIPVYATPGYVWVVRSVDVFLPGDTGSIYCNLVAAATGGTFFSAAEAVVSPKGEWVHGDMRQVFVPPSDGHIFSVNAGSALGSGPDCRISGYRLTLP